MNERRAWDTTEGGRGLGVERGKKAAGLKLRNYKSLGGERGWQEKEMSGRLQK